jgi:MYXO-CTERM domain-containing protein
MANWPNDPGYPGDWNYFSFLPMQQPGTAAYNAADMALGAAGMSIDKAWEYTIGDPTVTIMITDSGIEWEEPDLVNKFRLSVAELQNHKPLTSTGTACGGTGALAGYDCDGDGVLTVHDYVGSTTLTVPTGMCTVPGGATQMTPPPGDVNHNCILDPGDLIELFSDGVDDDANGYVDDIAGWDFYKDDNNPYDDVRYGHGTGESKDSSAQGNNGIGDIGVCPLCRFVMLRVGNSFIADSNNFAKAVVYATDNGANVVQEALGSINMTAFARAAVDYAYANNVMVAASMADENSRHHNPPATYNHTLPVHAIAYDGPSSTQSTTFLDFVNCTNYGGQLALSVSGTACSSEATGKTGGMTGLLYSYAKALNLSPALTAQEAMQLQKMTADTIDIAGSPSDVFYESLPGFSQRFGYGRTNMSSALAAMRNGLIPPEVDIVSPALFETLYADRVTGAVPLMGSIRAARATSYDYTIQWGPGVEPLDSDFQTLVATVMNVPGTTVTGGSAPLAMIDPSMINTAHTADPDSPHHENDRTVTLRVQVTAHYPGGGEAKGEARRPIAIVNTMNGLDTDLLPGFPIAIGGSVEAGTKLADIDGDGVRDIVAATNDGSIHVYSMKSGMPVEVAGFPYLMKPLDGFDPSLPAGLPSYLSGHAYKSGAISAALTREAIDSPVAIGDVAGGTSPEIVFSSWEGTVYVIDTTGKDVAGWPQRLPAVPSCPLDPNVAPPAEPCMDVLHDIARGSYASPVLVDLDGDGKLEIIVAAFDGNVYVWNGDGTPHAGFPVLVHSPLAYKYDHIITTPAVADFNGDGVPDIVVGSNETIGNQGSTGFFYIIDGHGNAAAGGPYLTNWPIQMPSAYSLPIVGQGTNASPAILDINGDGMPDVFLQGHAAAPVVVPGNPGSQSGNNPPASQLPMGGFAPGGFFGSLSNANADDIFLSLFSQPAVGDLDQDGIPDIIQSGAGISLLGNLDSNVLPKPFEHLLAMWSGKDGTQMPGSPHVLEDYTFLVNQAVADVTGDNYPEVILGTGGYFVHAVDACGREAPNWPKFTGGWMTASAAVGDVNGDHSLEVIEATRDGYIYAWTTKGTDTGVISWESFHHDNQNTGNYLNKLDQGVLEKAKTPIDCSMDAGATDAGTDSGTPKADAGKPDAGKDASVGKPDAPKPALDGGEPATAGGGGCGCTVTQQPRDIAGWGGLAFVGLALVRRRRR